jgi:hypothetical protein
MKEQKRIAKIHCYSCGKKRNSDIFIQSNVKDENGNVRTLKLKLPQLLYILKNKNLETSLLRGGAFISICPVCNTATPFMVNKNRKLTIIEDMLI